MFWTRFRNRPGPAVQTEPGKPHPSLLDTRAAITEFLFLRDEPGPVDFAFVLGSPTVSSMAPAIDLYRRRLAPKIVISGRGPIPGQVPEAEVYRDHAIECGVPAADIIVETQAANTKENFTFSRPVIEQCFGWDRVRAVAVSAKPFHMRRALMTARRHWPEHIELLMLPSNHPEDAPADSWWQTEHGRSYILAELRAIGTYALAGDIGGF